jgi:transposase-like protein
VNAKTRLSWILLYEQTKDFGLVCRRCGISRPTLRKWWRRYQTDGETGLEEKSRRPHKTTPPKVTESYEKLILLFRLQRNLGARRIQAELIPHHNFKLSTKAIEKVLRLNSAPPIRRHKNKQKINRYNRPVPGERVQIDTCKIADGIYQYTAIDDCTRFRALGIYSKRTAKNSVHFLEERLIEEFPFPIQRI